jgi:DNA-binding transcriptional LysR family regulator
MDREIDIGFVKEMPAFHELRSIVVHADELMLIASPRHPLAARQHVTVHDLANEPFVLHHQCPTTEQKILRMFEGHNLRCRIAAELWSFESVKEFVRQDVGLAVVPGVCVAAELAEGSLIRIPFDELSLPRRTLMIFRDNRYLSEPSQQFIKVISRMVESRPPTRAVRPSARGTRPGGPEDPPRRTAPISVGAGL